MKITIGFSPCPNDTYIFEALVNGQIDTEGLEFEVIMDDVQTLNEWAIEGRLDISKVSYATLPLVLDNYVVLNSGSALGSGVGPLLISKIPIPEPAVRQCAIAVPGQNTTANLLFSLAYPEATNKVFVRYDQVEEYVLDSADNLDVIQAVKLGVIIHENRFTYQSKGLTLIRDLGEFWEEETGFPIPLGGIVIKRKLDRQVQHSIDRLVRKSIEFADNRGGELTDFIRANSREMHDEVMRQHINLYVNSYSHDLGNAGRDAVHRFLQVHTSINKLPANLEEVFIS